MSVESNAPGSGLDAETVLLLPDDVVRRVIRRDGKVEDDRFGTVIQVGPYQDGSKTVRFGAKIIWQLKTGESEPKPPSRYPIKRIGTFFEVDNNHYLGACTRRIEVVGVRSDEPFSDMRFEPETIFENDID